MKMAMRARSLSLAALLSLAGTANALTIEVNTFSDDDGSNPDTCSLREALQAAKLNTPYGGCTTGERIKVDRIQLQAGSYVLTAPLAVDSEVVILGADTKRPDEVNPLTGRRPNRVRPLTTITAATNQRIIDMTGTTGGLVLTDLVLVGSSVTVDGGAIYATADVSLDNTVIRNATTTARGGAIYLATSGSNLSITDGWLQGNNALQGGGAVAMTCFENLADAAHQIEITRGLLVGNTSAAGPGVIAACGATGISLTATTLSGNVTAAGHGAIHYVVPEPRFLGAVNLRSVTALEQAGAGAVLHIGGISTFSMMGSLFAENDGPNCSVARAPGSRSGDYNAFSDVSCNSLMNAGTTNNKSDLVTVIGSEVAALADAGLTRVYLPLPASVHVRDQGSPLGGCSGTDQRGLTRDSGAACDRGAAERLVVTAIEDTGQNKVRTNRLAYVDVLANDTAGEGEQLVASSLEVLSQTTDKPGVTGSCSTVVNPAPVIQRPLVMTLDDRPSISGTAPLNSKVTVRFPDNISEEVFTRADGTFGPVLGPVGLRDKTTITATATTDINLPADTGNESLPDSILLDREADPVTIYPERSEFVLAVTTTTGEPAKVTCTYEVTDSAGAVSNVAEVEVTIKNMAPKAVKDEYLLKRGTRFLDLDLTANDSDEDDGKYGRNPDGTPKLPQYLVKIVNQPVLGRIEGDNEPCLDNTPTVVEVCFTGTVRYVPFNNQSPFDDEFSYRILDPQGEDSGTVTVLIKSDAPPEGQGGSAAPGLLLLLGLLGLRRLRRL